MKYLLIIFSIIGCFPSIAQRFPFPIQTKTLGNGLKIIHIDKQDIPMVNIQVWYRVGSKDETDGIRGMAHLFEHMMFRGSKNFQGEGDVYIHEIEKMGGNVNAYTTFDRTVYYQQIPKQYAEKVLMMEADRMSNLILDQKVLDVEREVVGEELRNGKNSWARRYQSDRHEQLYGENHPYKIDVIGYLDEILKFTTTQCQQFHKKYYAPNNAFVVIGGAISADSAFNYAEKAFGSLQPSQITPTAEPKGMGAMPLFDDAKTIDVPLQIYSFITNKPGYKNPDFAAFQVCSALLFGNSTSRIQSTLVDEQKLIYGLFNTEGGGDLYDSRTCYDLLMRAGPGNVKVKKVMQREINDFIENGPEDQELADYYSNIEATYVQQNYTLNGVVDLIGLAEFLYKNPLAMYQQWQDQKKVTKAELQRVAANYFGPGKMGFINYKPKDE
jgi:zinc protease